MSAISGLKKKEEGKATQRIYVQLLGVVRQAVQSVFVVTIRET